MNVKEVLNSKTTLEYLVLQNEQSYSQIGRELMITPQQFSDWIKKRRPVPEERLKALSNYFGIDDTYIVDKRNFVRELDTVSKIDIQMVLLKNKFEISGDETGPYLEKMEKLKKEKANQIRIVRLAAILQQDNDAINSILDDLLDQLESGNIENFRTQQ